MILCESQKMKMKNVGWWTLRAIFYSLIPCSPFLAFPFLYPLLMVYLISRPVLITFWYILTCSTILGLFIGVFFGRVRDRKPAKRDKLESNELSALASYYSSKASAFASLYFGTVFGIFAVLEALPTLSIFLGTVSWGEYFGLLYLGLLILFWIVGAFLGIHYYWYTDLASQAISSLEALNPQSGTMVKRLRLPGYNFFHKDCFLSMKFLAVALSYSATIVFFILLISSLGGINPLLNLIPSMAALSGLIVCWVTEFIVSLKWGKNNQ